MKFRLLKVRKKNNGRSAESSLQISKPDTDMVINHWNGATLQQNYPNPVVNETTIPVIIPNEVSEAMLVITGTSGQIVRSISLDQRGAFEIELSDLHFTRWHPDVFADVRPKIYLPLNRCSLQKDKKANHGVSQARIG